MSPFVFVMNSVIRKTKRHAVAGTPGLLSARVFSGERDQVVVPGQIRPVQRMFAGC